MDFVAEEWEKIPYPNCPFPLDPFLATIQVNYLRSLAHDSSTLTLTLPDSPILTMDLDDPTPEDALERILRFSPTDWAATKPPSFTSEWTLLGHIYQSAALLYCTTTLSTQFSPSQPSSPFSYDLSTLNTTHKTLLMHHLTEASTSLPVIRGSIWPIIVAGAVVAPDDLSARNFVRAKLDFLAEELAAPSLADAKGVFEGFWGSGRRGWDECFHRPYAFVQ